MKKSVILIALAASWVGLSTVSCKEKTGVCTACCGSSGTTYCKDGWTEADCKDFNNKKVNGLSWSWYEGQTCAGRGTPATP